MSPGPLSAHDIVVWAFTPPLQLLASPRYSYNDMFNNYWNMSLSHIIIVMHNLFGNQYYAALILTGQIL